MARDGILLFGGGGFIGQAMLARLNTAKRQVYVIGRQNEDSLEEVLPLCDTVIHLASTTTPSVSDRHPALELDNVAPTLRLLELVQHHPDTHLIFLSSGGTVYGSPVHLPVRENETIHPLSYHGAGKASIELFLNVLRQQMRITILRPSNIYGPKQSLRSGFGVIRHVLEHAYRNTMLPIWGDGGNVRDFIFIEDFIDVCEQFIDRPHDTDTYHVGTGRGYTLNDIVQLAQKITNKKLLVEYKSAREVDVKNITLDISHIKKTLNWLPQVDLEEGMRKTWQWIQHQ